MKLPLICVGLLAAAFLGACASTKPQPSAPLLVLVDYQADAQRDDACTALIGQAALRESQRGFSLAGMLNTNTDPKPGKAKVAGAPYSPLMPIGSHPAGAARQQMDNTSRRLFVNCETRQAYVSKRGGVTDITYWYGPFVL